MFSTRLRHPCSPVVLLIAGVALISSAGVIGAQGADAELRVVNAGADFGPVDVYLNGDPAIEALDYSQATEYLELPPGEYELLLTPAGEPPNGALIDAMVTLEPGRPHTVVAIGPTQEADIVVLLDDHTPPADGMSKISLVNVTTDGIDIDLALSDGSTPIALVPFADASEYVELDAGEYDVSVRAVNSANEIVAIPGFQAEAGNSYSIFAMGTAADYRGVVFIDALANGQPPTVAGTPTAAISATTEAGSDTAISTATPDATATPLVVTPTVVPALPVTGGGGTAANAGQSGSMLAIVAAVMALGGAAVWRFGSGFRLRRG